jgi:hypothetical protein
MKTVNTFRIERRLGGRCVTIRAEYAAAAELYCLTVRLDGDLLDTRQSDNVLADVGPILADVFGEILEVTEA